MKAIFNIKKLQFSRLHETNGVISYDTPLTVPGTVSLTMDVEQSVDPIYADGISYISIPGAAATSGTLENYFIPKSVLIDIYRYAESSAGEMMQTDDQPYAFGMQFACDDDEGKEVRFTYYNVTSTKPGVNLQTKESSTTINPQSVSLAANTIPVGDKNVTYSFATEEATNYATYFEAITIPTLPESI